MFIYQLRIARAYRYICTMGRLKFIFVSDLACRPLFASPVSLHGKC